MFIFRHGTDCPGWTAHKLLLKHKGDRVAILRLSGECVAILENSKIIPTSYGYSIESGNHRYGFERVA